MPAAALPSSGSRFRVNGVVANVGCAVTACGPSDFKLQRLSDSRARGGRAQQSCEHGHKHCHHHRQPDRSDGIRMVSRHNHHCVPKYELCIGTRKSSEEERQTVFSEQSTWNGKDRDETSIEVRGGAEGLPLGHAPGHGIERTSTALAWSTRA